MKTDKPRRLLIKLRERHGLGDWMMLTSILKMMKEQHPGIETDISHECAREDYNHLLIPELCGMNVPIVQRDESEYEWVLRVTGDCGCRPNADKHYMELNTETIGKKLGILIKYDLKRIVKIEKPKEIKVPREDYIVMTSMGRHKTGPFNEKNWKGMNELATRLSEDYRIVQVGLRDEPLLDKAEMSHMGIKFEELAWIIQKSRFVISLENGISHIAGHHSKRCFTIYVSKFSARPVHTYYPGQIPIEGDSELSVDYVYETIMLVENKLKSIW